MQTTTSETVSKLAAAMCAVQNELKAVEKGGKGHHGKYPRLEDACKAITPVAARHGLSIIQMPVSDDSGVGVETTVLHTSGEFVRCPLLLPLPRRDPQAAGSCITYARRYSLLGAFNLPAKDDDAELASSRPQQSSDKQHELGNMSDNRPVTQKQVAWLCTEAGKRGMAGGLSAIIKSKYNKDSKNDLTQGELRQMIAYVRQRPAGKQTTPPPPEPNGFEMEDMFHG